MIHTNGGSNDKKRFDAVESVIVANEKEVIIKHVGSDGPAVFSGDVYAERCSSTVIDKESLKLIQIRELHAALDHTQSAAGSAVLLRSLMHPGTNVKDIESKQESLQEIANDDILRQALQDFIHEYRLGENALFRFLNKGLIASFPYADFNKALKTPVKLVRRLKTIPQPKSSYLKTLISHLDSYKGTSIDHMMTGAIYSTFDGLKSDREVKWFTPKIKFEPHHFTRWILLGPIIALFPHLYEKFRSTPSFLSWMPMAGFIWMAGYAIYGFVIKPIRDTEKYIEPFRRRCIENEKFNRFIDSIGMIDELLSCHEFSRTSLHTVVLPEISDNPCHFFKAVGLRNPVTAKSDPEFVPNTVELDGAKLTFITGPNSGGKTTLCKSIIHNQLMAQMGSYVLAEKAAIGIAESIRYQAPKFDGLQDAEGRFGTELARTRDIFYATHPKSLVVLDELAEGATYEEKLQLSYEILDDFYTIGNNTILVTHNHSLADRFMTERKGQCLMAGFDGDQPTYRMVHGVSRFSHAEKIARKIRFSKKDRRRYLHDNGYL